MLDIQAIDHVGIRVFDLATARAFYEKLGFVFIAGPVGPEPVAIMRHPCGVVLNFILNAAAIAEENVLMDVQTKHAGYTHIALQVLDLEAVQRSLNEQSIVITEGPIQFGQAYGASLFIRDQDKNVIEFHQPASL
ncbi:MAG: VOC family protein [Mariprofundaceae bacterium]|nr:VOC family protein [Mariprofundaceae bacterium]